MKNLTSMDAKGRVSIGRHTTATVGQQFRIDKAEGGALTLTPVTTLQEFEQ